MCYGGCNCQRCNPPDEVGEKQSAWTTERPTAEGWYRYKKPRSKDVIMCYLSMERLLGLRVTEFYESESGLHYFKNPISEFKGEWQPVPPPQD